MIELINTGMQQYTSENVNHKHQSLQWREYDSILLQAGNPLFPVVQAYFVGEQLSASTNQVQSALDMCLPHLQ